MASAKVLALLGADAAKWELSPSEQLELAQITKTQLLAAITDAVGNPGVREYEIRGRMVRRESLADMLEAINKEIASLQPQIKTTRSGGTRNLVRFNNYS